MTTNELETKLNSIDDRVHVAKRGDIDGYQIWF